MSKTFTGFGFGPIQSALFLYEAYRSGNFASYVAVDIDRELVEAVRNNAGSYSINIAREHCIERFTVEGIEIYNPNILNDYSRIVDSVAESDELCTALPSVDIYAAGKNSVTGMIALYQQSSTAQRITTGPQRSWLSDCLSRAGIGRWSDCSF